MNRAADIVLPKLPLPAPAAAVGARPWLDGFELGLHGIGGPRATLDLFGAYQDVAEFLVTQSHVSSGKGAPMLLVIMTSVAGA